MVNSVGGSGNGSTSGYTSSTLNHSGGHSLQFTTTFPVAWSSGFVEFHSALTTPNPGGTLNCQVAGANPGNISFWIYSSIATAVSVGITDGTNLTYTSGFPANTDGTGAGIPAATWYNVVVPLTSGNWDSSLSAIVWTSISDVLIAPNDLIGSGTPYTSTVNIDDVYFY